MIQWTQATLNTIILAINNRAKIASPTFTGTVSGITKDMVGLNNVTNESKTTMFTNPTFTGTITTENINITALNLDLGGL